MDSDEKTTNTRVFLENLPKDIRKDEVDKTFSRFGRIAKVYLIYDPPGSGFVEYFDPRDAEYAANQMDGAEYLGSRVAAKVTRGGIARGRGGIVSRGGGRGGPPRGGYSSDGYGGYGGGRGGFSPRGGGFRGRGLPRGGFRGSSRGGGLRGRGGSRGSYSRGGSGGYSDRGGYRGSYSRGGSGYRGGYGSGGYDSYDKYEKSYDKPYEKYYEKSYEKSYDKSYEKPYEKSYEKSENGYSKYPPSEKYTSSYGSTRRDYARSRSPVNRSPERYRSSSPGYHRTRSRSPTSRGGGYGTSSSYYKQSSSGREGGRPTRSRVPRDYSPDRAYSRKEYSSSSYGGHRSPHSGGY